MSSETDKQRACYQWNITKENSKICVSDTWIGSLIWWKV